MRIAFVQTDVHGDVVVDVFFDNSSYGKVVVTMKKKLRREGGSRRSAMSDTLVPSRPGLPEGLVRAHFY